MKLSSIHYLPGNQMAAKQLGQLMSVPVHPISVHEFPDGESLIRITPARERALIYASLNQPDKKLIQLALAATAMRENGITDVTLVAPYLCYMRQDTAFKTGEAISQQVIGSFLSSYFDQVLTIDPHLHRINDLQVVFKDCIAKSYSAVASIAEALSNDMLDDEDWLLVGPDYESTQWVGAIADMLQIPFVVGEKIRAGDRDVSVALPNIERIKGVKAVIIDDIVSSGATVCQCAKALQIAGAASVELVTVHMLASETDIAAIKAAGVSRIRSSDSVTHSTNAINLAPLLAEILLKEA